NAAAHARQASRKELVASLKGVDDDDLIGEREGGLERFRQAALDARLHDQSIDDDFDGVVASAIEFEVFVERSELTVDAGLAVAALAQRLQLLLELAFAAPYDGRHDVDARIRGIQHDEIEDALERLRRDFAPAVVAMRRPGVGEEQPQI